MIGDEPVIGEVVERISYRILVARIVILRSVRYVERMRDIQDCRMSASSDS